MALVLRADRKMFYGVKGSTSEVTYTRMKGFTSLTESKNPIEYTRHYDFNFDMLDPNAVLTDMAKIIDGEELGTDAVRSFVSVDFNKPISGSQGAFEAVKRDYAIIGDSIGDGTDALTYSGTLRVQSTRIEGKATIATPTGGDKDTVETITFEANSD